MRPNRTPSICPLNRVIPPSPLSHSKVGSVDSGQRRNAPGGSFESTLTGESTCVSTLSVEVAVGFVGPSGESTAGSFAPITFTMGHGVCVVFSATGVTGN